MNVVLDIVIVLVIASVGGFFASAEMALVSLREGQVRSLSQRGRRGATAARLASDPNRFLASVQIGTTLATLVTGAYGADTLSKVLSKWLAEQGLSRDWASPLAYVIVTAAVTFLSLVVERAGPEAAGAAAHGADRAVRRADAERDLPAGPAGRLAAVGLRQRGGPAARGRPGPGPPGDDRAGAARAGHRTQTLSADERRIVGEVFDAGKRQIREVLRPRTEVEFLPAGITVGEAARIASSVPYSRLPVYRDSYDNVLGFVHIRDLLGTDAPPRTELVDGVVRPVKFLPISKTVLSALSEMRRERVHLAIVADEYGGTAGIVTLEDLVEELIGDITDEYDSDEAPATRLPQGEVEVDGLLNLDEFAEQTGIRLPEGPYETVAGFVLAALGELPAPGDTVRSPATRSRSPRWTAAASPGCASPLTPTPSRRRGRPGSGTGRTPGRGAAAGRRARPGPARGQLNWAATPVGHQTGISPWWKGIACPDQAVLTRFWWSTSGRSTPS